jgi:ubiquinone/menaquinone biosynthesis C-methylase UbiE
MIPPKRIPRTASFSYAGVTESTIRHVRLVIMSTGKIYNATIKQILNHVGDKDREFLHLDIGSGSGDLIIHLKNHLKTSASCCDYTDELMKLPDQQVDIVDLNKTKKLPYENNKFDIITMTEVVEHLEDFRAILREVYRVLKLGGICVLTTPNILNLNSRLRNLWFGFAELMGPLPVQNRKMESCAGHINPVSLFYILHALQELNFQKIDFTVDRYQRSSIAKGVFLLLPIKLLGALMWMQEVKKYKTIDESNREIVLKLNSLPVLFGRTSIVSAKKFD